MTMHLPLGNINAYNFSGKDIFLERVKVKNKTNNSHYNTISKGIIIVKSRLQFQLCNGAVQITSNLLNNNVISIS